jgi:hypothetical protein
MALGQGVLGPPFLITGVLSGVVSLGRPRQHIVGPVQEHQDNLRVIEKHGYQGDYFESGTAECR